MNKIITKISKERLEKMKAICLLLKKKSAQIEKSHCYGKWAGTYDYSLRFSDGSCLFLCNGAAGIDKIMDKIINSGIVFHNKLNDIYQTLEEIREKDRIVAEERGLMTYQIEDVSLKLDGISISVVVTLRLSNGDTFAMRETNQSHCLFGNIAKNGLEQMKTRSERSYFPDGRLIEEDIDFIYHNVGFASKKDLYNCNSQKLCS